MDSEKPINVDEKTAKIIEEIDKSLRTMEQSLGMDHPVVAKICDSYAKILRQNNVRHLDALNMEARAKAIRAKNNQQESEAQTKGIETAVVEQKSVSIGQVRAFGWAISVIILGGLAYGALDLMKKSEEHAAKAKAIAIAREQKEKQDAQAFATSWTPTVSKGAVDGGEQDAQQMQAAAQTAQPTDPSGGQPGGAGAQSAAGQMTAAQTEQRDKIKELAKEQLDVGQAAEKAGDNQAATQAYSTVISAVQTAPMIVGRPVYSDEIASCMEGYARMAKLAEHPEVADQWEKVAATIRAHGPE